MRIDSRSPVRVIEYTLGDWAPIRRPSFNVSSMLMAETCNITWLIQFQRRWQQDESGTDPDG